MRTKAVLRLVVRRGLEVASVAPSVAAQRPLEQVLVVAVRVLLSLSGERVLRGVPRGLEVRQRLHGLELGVHRLLVAEEARVGAGRVAAFRVAAHHPAERGRGGGRRGRREVDFVDVLDRAVAGAGGGGADPLADSVVVGVASPCRGELACARACVIWG